MKYIKKILLIIIIGFLSSLYSINTNARSMIDDSKKFVYDEEYFDKYTDSDYLLDETSYKITDYIEKLYASNSKIVILDYTYEKTYYGIEISGDDPIIDIIPREVFMYPGEYMHIGREYGFYVDTINITDYELQSSVFVFDIIKYPLNDSNNPSQYIIEVRPLFQRDYLFISSDTNNSYIINEFDITIKSNLSNYVIPSFATKFNGNELIEIKEYKDEEYNKKDITELTYYIPDDYFIKDVSFGLTLQNEQELNIGDLGYDKYKDEGSFISRCNINYSGSSKFWAYDASKAVISCGIGFIPYLGDACSIFSCLNEVYNSGKEENINNCSYEDQLEMEFYNSKVEQLDKYVNLNKFSIIKFNSDDGKPILFSTNENSYVKSFFTIGQTEDWYTRAYDYLKIEIVQAQGFLNKYIVRKSVVSERTTMNYLRSIKNKKLNFDNEVSFNLLPFGKNRFEFDAKYVSDYDISISNQELLDVTIDGNKAALIENKGILNLSKGKHFIEINGKNTDSIEISIIITPLNIYKEEFKSIKLKPYEEFIVKINSIDDIYEYSTNDIDVLISDIFINNKFEKDYIFGFVYPHQKVSFPFRNETCYIILKNTSNSYKNISFTKKQVITIKENEDYFIEVNDTNYTYLKFKSDFDSEFSLVLDDYKKVKFCVIDLEKKSYVNGSYYHDLYYKFTVKKEQTVYIGIEANNKNLKLKISSVSSLYKWKIKYDNNIKLLPSNSQIEIDRGKYVEYELLYNDNTVVDLIYKDSNSNTYFGEYKYLIIDNTSIYLDLDCPLGGNGIIIEAGYENAWISKIIIVPKMDDHIDNIITGLVNDEDLGFNYCIDQYVHTIEFQIFPLNIYCSVNIENDEIVDGKRIGYVSIFNDEVKKVTKVNYVRIKILKLYYYDSNHSTIEFDNICTSVETTNILYGFNYDLGNCYYISSVRHFENIRLNPSYKYKLTKDLILDDWKNFTEFEGTLNGNGKMITMRISVVDYRYDIGLFSKNSGTISKLNLKAQIILKNSIDEWQNVGGIAAVNEGTIENCKIINYVKNYYKNVKDDVYTYNVDYYIGTYSKTRIGAFVGYNRGIIRNCITDGLSIMGSGDIGGIVGVSENGSRTNALIDNCKSNCRIFYFYCNENRSVAGIVGYQISGTTSNCYNDGTISFEIDAGHSRTIQPNMAEIIGHNSGESKNNTYNGFVDTNGLNFKPGFLGIACFDQVKYAKDREIGKQD